MWNFPSALLYFLKHLQIITQVTCVTVIFNFFMSWDFGHRIKSKKWKKCVPLCVSRPVKSAHVKHSATLFVINLFICMMYNCNLTALIRMIIKVSHKQNNETKLIMWQHRNGNSLMHISKSCTNLGRIFCTAFQGHLLWCNGSLSAKKKKSYWHFSAYHKLPTCSL